jgi:hypothetical protein
MTGLPAPPATYSNPFASTAMLRLSGPSALNIRAGLVAAPARRGKTNDVASERNDRTYRCPEASNVTPEGSRTAAGLPGFVITRAGATEPALLAGYAATGPESALAT